MRIDTTDQDLVNAPAIHVHDFDSQAIPDEIIRRGRQPSEVSHDESGEGMIVAFFFSGQHIERKYLLEVRDGQSAVEQPGAVLTLDGETIGLSWLRRHVTDHRFE